MARVEHTCTGCVPIDASIIDVYVTLVETNKAVTNAEAGRVTAEGERVAAETERTATFTADHGRAVSDHSIAQQDHALAGTDHSASAAATASANAAAALANLKAGLVQQRLDTADADHTRAEGDHNTAVSDHSTALADHSTAQSDHSAAGTDHTRAGQDHSRAETDHGVASSDHETAASDHETAVDDHALADSDHETASADHTLAASDHTTAASDHGTATADHTQASADHTQAGTDHSTAASDHTAAASDHTRAGQDHTLAAADHTTAGEDHTQALADHAVMSGYDTRLGAVEDDVTELEAKVGELPEKVENDEIDNSYTKKSVGGQSSVIMKFVSGTAVTVNTKYPLFIPSGTKFKINVKSNTVFSDNTVFPIYLWYSDGTRSASFSPKVGNAPVSVIIAEKDVVALASYFTSPSVTSSGDVKVVIEFVEVAFTEVYNEIAKQREVIPLRYIGLDSTLVNDWNIGEMYYDVAINIIRRCISTSPLNFESINATDSLYKVGDELFLFDGISLKRYYNNVLFDGEVIVDYPLYVVGPAINNEGNNTYVYKTIADSPVSPDDAVLVTCDEVIGATSASYITIYGMKNGVGTEIGYLKSGRSLVYPSTEYDSIKIRLYPATSGMSARYAVYKNVRITKSKCGDIQIKESLLEKFIVPAYYIKGNYLKNKIATIRSAIKASGGDYDAFVFCTDIHWTDNAKNSPAIIRYICKKVGIHRLFLGGDYANGINIDCNNAINEAFLGRIYRVAGNHEYMNYFEEDGVSTQTDISDAEVWEYLNDGTFDAVSGNPEESYFYVDNPIQKMRYIILSVFSDGSVDRFSNEQEAWFRDVALNLPDGYTAIVFSHYFVYADFPTFENKQFTTIGTKVATIVDAYDGNGEVACLLQGHTHYDLQTTTPGGVPVIATTCDKDTPTSWETTNQPEESAYIYGKRVRGTITEQAFDVVVIDKKNKLVTLVRIGAPADVDGETFAETRSASY